MKRKYPKRKPKPVAEGTTLGALSAAWHLSRLGTITPDDPTRSLTLLSQGARQLRGDEPGDPPTYGTLLLTLLSAAQCVGVTAAAVLMDAAAVGMACADAAAVAAAHMKPDQPSLPGTV